MYTLIKGSKNPSNTLNAPGHVGVVVPYQLVLDAQISLKMKGVKGLKGVTWKISPHSCICHLE